MPKGTLLPTDSTPTTDDIVTITDMAGPTTKKITIASLFNIGTVNAAKMSNPYKFSVYLSSDAALTANTFLKVPFDVKLFDTSSNFSTTTNRFTAPVAGFYYLDGQVGLTGSGASSGIITNALIKKNGVDLQYASNTPGTGTTSSIPRPKLSGLFQLAANDYIELYGMVGENGRAIQGGSVYTFFTGFLVCTT